MRLRLWVALGVAMCAVWVPVSVGDGSVAPCEGGSCRDCVQIGPCETCSAIEQQAKTSFCQLTGKRRPVRCDTGNSTSEVSYQPCLHDVKRETREWWTFEGTAIALSVLAVAFVWWRRKALAARQYRRLRQQIDAA